jgi:hypothetical protein
MEAPAMAIHDKPKRPPSQRDDGGHGPENRDDTARADPRSCRVSKSEDDATATLSLA